jgi:hypothetical protein
MTKHIQRAWAVGRRLALPVGVALAFAGCRANGLLDVDTPDQIPPGQVNNPAGAQALRVAAVGNFSLFLGGDAGGSGFGMTMLSGLLADELRSARGGSEHIDSRAENDALFPSTNWTFVGEASTQIIRAIKALNEYPPTSTVSPLAASTEIGQLYGLQGFTYVITGEAYCNGVPFGNADDAHPATETLSNEQLFNRAVSQFDSALAAIGTGTTSLDTSLIYLALVGKGRALLDLGQYDDAATAVTSVPTSFKYQVEYSKNSTSIVNAAYDWAVLTTNFGPSNKEGGNGLDFVDANDPRIPIDRNGDGTVKYYTGQDGTQVPKTRLYGTPDAPISLATGIEARLIEAEAALPDDPGTFISKLNEARATNPSLGALTDPGSQAARVDLLFRERAFWMYLTAHRVGDLRRLVRQYGRNAETVWPTGDYFKGGVYGTDQNLTPSQAEKNNPDWQGCTDRNP